MASSSSLSLSSSETSFSFFFLALLGRTIPASMRAPLTERSLSIRRWQFSRKAKLPKKYSLPSSQTSRRALSTVPAKVDSFFVSTILSISRMSLNFPHPTKYKPAAVTNIRPWRSGEGRFVSSSDCGQYAQLKDSITVGTAAVADAPAAVVVSRTASDMSSLLSSLLLLLLLSLSCVSDFSEPSALSSSSSPFFSSASAPTSKNIPSKLLSNFICSFCFEVAAFFFSSSSSSVLTCSRSSVNSLTSAASDSVSSLVSKSSGL
mmetsp:Transcript_25110/g.47199  ORF Transcript_25110/g.47199 Transcript_25110/m.47199 type:complete len:262 (+) Transcript_25110:919-1704(+)